MIENQSKSADLADMDDGDDPDPFQPLTTSRPAIRSNSTAALEQATTTGSDDELILSPADPLVSARRFIEFRYTTDDQRTLHHHDGTFLAWDGVAAYEEREDSALRAEVYEFLERAQRWRKDPKTEEWSIEPFRPNRNKVNDAIDAIRAVTNLPRTDLPCWLDGRQDRPSPAEVLPLRNTLLHVPAGTTQPPSPALLTLNRLPFDYDADAPAPREWLKFLDQLWPDDQQAIDTLQEVVGYLLLPDTSAQKAFFLVGPKRSGKGTIARVVTALLGQRNVVNPTLAQLGHQFGLAPLIHKTAAIITDARLSGRADTPAIAERLLSISGEDQQTIDRKHRSAWTGYLKTRFLVLSNELPKINDASGALASRFIVLSLRRSFYGEEDPFLTRRLMGELPSILNWALAGWERLQERGHFVQPESSREAVQELEDLASPVGAFLRQRCLVAPEAWVSVDGLYEAWCHWCEANGQEHTSTKQRFSRDLRTVLPQLSLKRTRPNGGGPRSRHFVGLRLKTIWELDDDQGSES